MTQSDAADRRVVQGDLAALTGTIERASADLALGEEPSNFERALQTGAPRD
jgi:hypothetical protein